MYYCSPGDGHMVRVNINFMSLRGFIFVYIFHCIREALSFNLNSHLFKTKSNVCGLTWFKQYILFEYAYN